MQMMRRGLVNYAYAGLLLLSACKKQPVDAGDELISQIYFTPTEVHLVPGQIAQLSLNIQHFPQPIYAVSFQLCFNDSVLTFSDSTGVIVGEYFGENTLLFVCQNSAHIHLSISKTQNPATNAPSNSLCRISFTGVRIGKSQIMIIPEELHFYNSDGEVLLIPDLEVKTAEIYVDS